MIFKKTALAAAIALSLVGCSKVPAGNVGVKVYLLGGSKGVDTEELSPGRYWIGWNEDLFLFPTFTQNYVWTRDNVPGSETNEELGFQTIEGLAVTADVGISYRIDPSQVPLIYQKYRRGIDEITDLYLRNMVRDALVKNASNMKVEAVYGAGKTDLIEAVQKNVSDQVKDLGIIIEKVYWIGELRLPENVMGAINAKIQATQMAEQRRNEVEQAMAEAQKVRASAQGDADAKLMMAKAEAQSIELRGDALARNPKLVELQAIEKWNGVLPVTMLNNTMPFLPIK
jgi:regulator of protease activity HflC (stomatin/prohibitin superfamily)